MLEIIIAFAVIVFAGLSVSLGVLLGRRTPEQGCHCEIETGSQQTASKCGSCQIIDARRS